MRFATAAILSLAGGLLWAGPCYAQPYELAAVAPANAALETSLKACTALLTDPGRVSAYADCIEGAERQWALSIRLTRTDLTDAYLAKVRATIMGMPANPKTFDEARAEGSATRREYLAAIRASK